LRTGDYWCGPSTNIEMANSPVILLVGGMMEDKPKLEAIRDILEGQITRCRMEFFRKMTIRDYELSWFAQEHTERYLRWFEDKWQNHGIIDAHNKRRWVRECLEVCDAYHQHRQA
jgi:hypothetical protein